MAICNIIKELRENKKISMSKIAEALKIPKGTYASYEYGQREPNIEMINRIADFYGVTTDYLLGREPLPDPFADLKLSEDIEDDVMAKFTSLSPEVRAVVLDVIAQLGDIIRAKQSESKVERVATTAGELEDQWKAEQDVEKGGGKSA